MLTGNSYYGYLRAQATRQFIIAISVGFIREFQFKTQECERANINFHRWA